MTGAGRISDRVLLAAGLGTALFVRLGLVVATRHQAVVADPADYHRLGLLLADGRGFGRSVLAAGGGPTAFRPPLYPLFLGLVYRVTGDSVTAARVTQALLGVVTVALLALIADMIWGRRVARVVLLVSAVYPPLVFVGTPLLSESISLPLQLGAIAAGLQVRRGRAPLPWAAVTGLLLGLGVLARPTLGALAVPIVVLLLTAKAPWRARLTWTAVAGLTAVATLVPWEVRTYRAFDAFVPVSTLDGYVLAGVYNRQADEDPRDPGQWRNPTGVPAMARHFRDPTLDELELSQRLRKTATDYASAHPGYVGRVVGWNTVRLFDLTGLRLARASAEPLGFGPRVAEIWLGSYAVAMILAVAGACTRLARRAPLGLWIVVPAVVAATVPTLGTSRYRSPIEPVIVLLACLAITTWLDRRTSQAAS